jgi:flagellar protein FlaF
LQNLAFKAYGEVQQRTAGEKEIEYALFQQITEALEDVSEPDTVSPGTWGDAIYRNQQLWTLLATDLMSEANALPAETRQQLLGIAQFVRQYSMRVLAGEGDISELIEVNRTIMAGLSGAGAPTPNGESS